MSLKKLAAGSGYEYLTRQVAAADSTELGSMPLADYYVAKGEAPGRWIGSGLVGIDGLEDGDVVTAEHMKNLFGEGHHPITGAALGRGFRKGSVAGFDLTFSPAKSVSTLWALAPPEVAKQIRMAHDAAVVDALEFLETHAVFTREGTGGVRQVECRGLVAAAFTHRDSRAGDPDLHTHVAVANKVQTRQGRWLAIYGTVLHEHVVAASEAYNTALEAHLRETLGVRFVDVDAGRGKRPIREIDGVDPQLCRRWSQRRSDIEQRLEEIRAEFTTAHGRTPSSKESIALAQRANLETRQAKHDPRSEAEQRATWRAQAEVVLGTSGVHKVLDAALYPAPSGRLQLSPAWLTLATGRLIAEVEAHRATWQSWHLYAEAQRQVRDIDVAAAQVPGIVEQLLRATTSELINLTPDRDPISEPPGLCRSDGTSVYRHTGADHFTSQRMLDAEQRILTTAGLTYASSPDAVDVELALMKAELAGAPVGGTGLNAGQRKLVHSMAADPHQIVLALAPAGSGKTSAMDALARVWEDLGYGVVGLAPSAAAAAVLGEATGMPTETLARFDHALADGGDLDAFGRIGPHTVVVIDEAGMADTPTLDRVIAACTQRGSRVRLIGDDRQLASVGAGGVLRDIAATHGALRLEEVVRFTDPIEAQASLDLRAGDRAALGYYLDHDRVHAGDLETCLVEVLTAWAEERAAGQDCLMLAPTRDLVARLNRAARDARLGATDPGRSVDLADGNQASVGDTILTRHNDRRLGVCGRDWVKNGDRWTITVVRADGSVEARHQRSHLNAVLPSEYVVHHVELGYATTVHAAQGTTADVMHGIVLGTEDRNLLYTMLTRGREQNHVHLVLDDAARDEEEQFLPGIAEQLTTVEILDRVVERDGAAVSATSEGVGAASAQAALHEAAQRYTDAVTTVARQLLGATEDALDAALEMAGPRPLPWLPAIPAELAEHPQSSMWSTYLQARAERVTQLVEQVRRCEVPEGLSHFDDVLTKEIREDLMLWRAATGVPEDNRSLFGPRPHDPAADRYVRHLQRQIDDLYPPTVRRWEHLIAQAIAHSTGRPQDPDHHTLDLARELDRLQHAGLNAEQLLRRANSMRTPLPENHTVEALGYRLQQLARSQREVAAPLPRRDPVRRAPGLGL